MTNDYGLSNALNVSFDADKRIEALRYQDQIAKQNQAMASAKAKMFADEADFQNAMNAHDQPIVKKFSTQVLFDVAKYRRENPDWEYNNDKRLQVKLMLNQLRSNPDLLRGMASDEAIKRLNNDLAEVAKNPNQHNQKAYNNVQLELDNYIKYGNQHGPDALLTEGKKAFIYQKPPDFVDLQKEGQDIGSRFKGAAMNLQPLNNGRDGAFITTPKTELLNSAANQLYLSRKEQFDQQHPGHGLEAAKQFILSGVDTKFDIGKKNDFEEKKALLRYSHGLKMAAEKKSKGINASTYEEAFYKPGYVNLPSETLAKTFGSNVKHYFIDGNGKIIENQGDNFNYTGDAYDENYRVDKNGNPLPYNKTGIKITDGYIYKPLKWGSDNGYTANKWFGTGEDAEYVLPEHEGFLEIVDSPIDKDGNTRKMLKVKVHAKVDGKSAHAKGKFDQLTETNKQIEGSPIGVQSSQLYADDLGRIFDAYGNYLGGQ